MGLDRISPGSKEEINSNGTSTIQENRRAQQNIPAVELSGLSFNKRFLSISNMGYVNWTHNLTIKFRVHTGSAENGSNLGSD